MISMKISEAEHSAIMDAIAYARCYVEVPEEPMSRSLCASFDALALKVINGEDLTLGETRNLALALELYISQEKPSSSVYSALLHRYSKILSGT